MHLWTAIRAFFGVLFNNERAKQVQRLLSGEIPGPATVSKPTVSEPKSAPVPVTGSQRSDALTLLATLQREARWLDYLSEDLQGYNDAQVGAVSRDVQRDCRQVIERLFSVRAVSDQTEGTQLTIPANIDAARLRVLGAGGSGTGVVLHPGWLATKCELPVWQGKPDDRLVLMATEIEAR